jgi:hypothetical protein
VRAERRGACSATGPSKDLSFPAGRLLAVSIIIAGDLFCFARNVDYRLDTPSARAFLDDFLNCRKRGT